jgi:zinc protease
MSKSTYVTSNIRLAQGPIKGISEYRMRNGLKIVLMPDASSAAITSFVVYRVGSRNEGPGNTGSAHFFEHLMFKGSRRFNPDAGTNIDLLTKEIGAALNAYTSNDQTVYHIQASPEHLELCLAIEADRMRGLRMRVADRDSEMTVVRNEMEQGENWPQQALRKQLFATAFSEHPYHHDTIGSRTEVENVPLASMRAFYHTYYWPNNATVIVVGNFETPAALALIEKHFGRITKSPRRIPKVYTVEPPQEGERRFEIRRHGNLYRLTIGYHVPEAAHADQPALQALSQILGSSYSRSSRFCKRLVDGGMASSVYAFSDQARDPSLMQIDADLNATTSLEAAEAAILEEIERIKSDGVTAEELALIKEGNRKDTKLRLAEPKYFGYQLAQAEAVADWTWLFTSDDAFDAVTAADVQRVAVKYLTKDNRTVGAFVPKSDDEVAGERSQKAAVEKPKAVAVKPRKVRKSLAAGDEAAIVRQTIARFQGTAPARRPISQRVVTRTLANGLTVNVLPEKLGSGAVAVATAIKCGNYFERGGDLQNLADIVGSMLPMGSVGLTKEQLADELTSIGIRNGLMSWVGPYILQARSQVVVEDLPHLLGLLSTVVRKPAFNAADLETVKNEWRNRYKQELANPGSVTANRLGSVLYPPNAMFHQKSPVEQTADLERMTLADLTGYHSQFYTPGNTLLTLVGDIEPEAAIAAIEAAFGDWQGAASPAISVEVPELQSAAAPIVIQMPDKPGISIVLGHPLALKKSDPDCEATQIALAILGGDTMTARLGKKLREEGGLTYGVYAGQWDNSFGAAPWYIDLSVNKDNVTTALAMAREILADFVANGITQAELATQINNRTGSYQLRLTTMHELAGKIGEFAALGLSLDGIDNYTAELRAITVADVNAAIAKHLHPDAMVTVIAGDVI